MWDEEKVWCGSRDDVKDESRYPLVTLVGKRPLARGSGSGGV